MGRPTVFTVNKHPLPEVVSALQKAIRRSQMDDALYWAVDMDLSGYGKYCWRRLRLIASEDVALRRPGVAAEVRALYESWVEETAAGKDGRLFLVHAVLLLASAPKSRLTDWMLITHYSDHAELRRDIPDEALDKHTARGKRLGRGHDHFVDEGAHLEFAGVSEDLLGRMEDVYRESARRVMNEGKVSQESPTRATVKQRSLEDAMEE